MNDFYKSVGSMPPPVRQKTSWLMDLPAAGSQTSARKGITILKTVRSVSVVQAEDE